MTSNTDTNSDAFIRLLDDLLWLHGRGSRDGLREAVDAMIASYADDVNHYSDGSVVLEWYQEYPGHYFRIKGALHLPPHRRATTTGPEFKNGKSEFE
jgi:hypothetical protein